MASGLDQHLKDMINPSGNSCGLKGRTPVSLRPFFFGANLTALQKKRGVSDRWLHITLPSSQGDRK